MQVEYNLEWLPDLWDELEPLMFAHYREVDENASTVDLKIDKRKYNLMAEADAMKFFIARSEGKIVGYLSMYLISSMHNQDRLVARSDALYLKPEARIGSIGYNMIKVADKYLFDMGVQEIYHSSPAIKDISALFRRLGYSEVETVYSKKQAR